MDSAKRLALHLDESLVHINRLKDILPSLKLLHPLSVEKFIEITQNIRKGFEAIK